MSHRISWDNQDHSVVLQEYIAGASKDDLYLMAEESAKMLKTVDHTVHIILDGRNMDFPLSMTDLRYLDRQVPKNQGSLVVLMHRQMQKVVAATQDLNRRLTGSPGQEALYADTIEEARQLLHDQFGVQYP